MLALSIISIFLLSGCTSAPAATPLTYSDSDGKVALEMSFPDNWKKISSDETGKETLVPITTLENMTRYTDGTSENKIYLTILPSDYLETYKDWKNALVQLYLVPSAEDLQVFYEDAGHKGPGYEYTGKAVGTSDTNYKVAFWNTHHLVVLEMPKKSAALDKIVSSVFVKF